MILADTLKTLTTFSPAKLTKLLGHCGYPGQSFKTADFLGITNGGQFCYRVEYHDDADLGRVCDKVYVNYNHSLDAITAEF